MRLKAGDSRSPKQVAESLNLKNLPRRGRGGRKPVPGSRQLSGDGKYGGPKMTVDPDRMKSLRGYNGGPDNKLSAEDLEKMRKRAGTGPRKSKNSNPKSPMEGFYTQKRAAFGGKVSKIPGPDQGPGGLSGKPRPRKSKGPAPTGPGSPKPMPMPGPMPMPKKKMMMRRGGTARRK